MYLDSIDPYVAVLLGTLVLPIVVGVVIYLSLALACAIVAARNGRTAIGWLVLSLIFPFAILFVSIAPALNRHSDLGPREVRHDPQIR